MFLNRIFFLMLLLCSIAHGLSARQQEESAKLLQGTPGLLFVENKGQITDQYHTPRKDINYKLESKGVTVFIRAGKLHYQWSHQLNKPQEDAVNTEFYRLDMALYGADTNAVAIAEDPQTYYERYYTGIAQEPQQVHSFRKITYKNIYPHIDWILYCNEEGLKYDFVVHPGGNAGRIKIRYQGADGIMLADGALQVQTEYGTVTEQRPYSYELNTGRTIASAYSITDNTIGFEIAPYNSTVVIDPVLDWSTYYGTDPVSDYSTGLGTDLKGNAYMGGVTYSTSNIATTGAHKYLLSVPQAELGDAYLAKFSTTGIRLWATYYGGSLRDDLTDIAVTPAGDIYITGTTVSDTGIATAGSHQPQYGGGPVLSGDIFLAKFNADGIRQWGTYYGGYMGEYNPRVCTDAANNVYLSGTTTSYNDIVPANGPQRVLNGGQDGFVAKFTAGGSRVWATYCGGNNYHEQIEAITADDNGNVYVAGFTTSDNDIATAGTHQVVFGNPLATTITDGFIIKLDNNGNKVWGSYYGGSDYDYIQSIICAKDGSLYIAGRTLSNDKIATPGALQPTRGASDYDGFIARMNADGTRDWGTYLGGNQFDEIDDIAFKDNNLIYAGGTTYSNGLSTAGSMNATIKGDADAFIAILTTGGQKKYLSYFGGNNFDQLAYLCPDNRGNLFICGNTSSSIGISTPGAYKEYYSGSSSLYDGFLSKINFDSLLFFNQYFDRADYCAGDTFTVMYDVTRAHNSGNVFVASLSDADGDFNNSTIIGFNTATSGGNIFCTLPFNLPAGVKYRIRLLATNYKDTSTDNGLNMRIGQMPVVSATSGGDICAGDSIILNLSSDIVDVVFNWQGPSGFAATVQSPVIHTAGVSAAGQYIGSAAMYGCKAYDTVEVAVKPLPNTPKITSNSPVCEGSSLLFHATGTANAAYVWQGPAGFLANTADPYIVSAPMAAFGIYTIVASLNGCTSVPAKYTAVIKPVPDAPDGSTNSPVCEEDTLILQTKEIKPGILYNWSGPNAYTSSMPNSLIQKSSMGFDGLFILTASLNGCIKSDTVSVSIKPAPRPVIISNEPVWENEDLQLSVAGTRPGTSYYWTGPNNFTSEKPDALITNVTDAINGRYVVNTTLDGCAASDEKTIRIQKITEDLFILYPSPNNGNFTIEARLKNKQAIHYEIVSATGQLIFKDAIPEAQKTLRKQIRLEDRVANGIYYFRISINGTVKNIAFVINK